MVKLLIIADDFTGALDTGVQFAKKGISVLVTQQMDLARIHLREHVQVLVMDTESRHVEPEEAARRIWAVVSQARSQGVRYYYKKTDSTLRGNIGAELAAMMEACDDSPLMFIPAFPKTGRTTVEGVQYVDGVVLQDTPYAKDPLNPLIDSYIPDLIRRQSPVEVKVIEKGDLLRFGSAFPSSAHVLYVFDGQEDADLEQIGYILQAEGLLRVSAGCAGFAEVLSGLLDLPAKAIDKLKVERSQKLPGGSRNPVLVVAGSVHENSLAQVRYAEEKGWVSFALSPEEILDENFLNTPEGMEIICKAVETAGEGKDIILKTLSVRQEMEAYLACGSKKGMAREDIHLTIAQNMGQMAATMIQATKLENVVVLGGDTLMGVMEALGVQGLIPWGEIQPGVVASEIDDGDSKLCLVTKAGGFGHMDVLIRIREYLRKGE